MIITPKVFDLHCELDKRLNHLKKRREWIKRNGETLRDGVYLGIGLILAGLVAFIADC